MISETNPSESLVPRSSCEVLCSNLAEGLHAAAQPLSVLQASLDNTFADRMSMDEFRELMANSALEVDRVCRFFSCLRQLVSTESIKPQLSATQILPLLTHVADGVNQLFEKDGMFFCALVPETCDPVLINRARTLHALSNVLLIAHAVSHVQDTVELIASSTSSNAVRILVQNQNSNVNALSAEASLSMALAEANMRSQQADFSLSLRPFRVQIELRKASGAHYC